MTHTGKALLLQAFDLRAALASTAIWTLALLLAGCASQGPLRPPTLRLPAEVRGLTAQRSGRAVDLAWTNPTRTTDGVSLTGKHGAGSLSAEICRAEFPATTACAPLMRFPVVAGAPSTFRDMLPADLQTGPARALHYSVRIRNGRGKGAAFADVLTAAGDAPAPILGLTASPVAGGIALRWQPGAGPQDRTLLRVVRGEPAAPAFRKTPDEAAPSTPSGTAAATAASKPPTTTLMALEPSAHDPGGALDSAGHAGVEQVYTVYRSRTVRIGSADVLMEGESASVTVAASALAPPPAPPTGLEAVANTLGAPAIDLVWQASTEPGVSGYLVYRSEYRSGDGGAATQLTMSPVRGFSYSDGAARVGVVYRYSVASVSTDGRAGARSPEISASIPQP